MLCCRGSKGTSRYEKVLGGCGRRTGLTCSKLISTQPVSSGSFFLKSPEGHRTSVRTKYKNITSTIKVCLGLTKQTY